MTHWMQGQRMTLSNMLVYVVRDAPNDSVVVKFEDGTQRTVPESSLSLPGWVGAPPWSP